MVSLLNITKSKLRQKILLYFFTNPSGRLYLREAAALLKEDPGNLSKEFSRLVGEGIFSSEMRGNQKYFQLNKAYPLYSEVRSIVFKTIGVVGTLKEIMEKTAGIKLSLIYGSYAADKENADSDIDLLIVGNPDEDKLMDHIEKAEKMLHREINYNIYPAGEFKSKKDKGDSFIRNILSRPKIVLTGTIDGN